MELMNIKSLHKRESERRRINRGRSENGLQGISAKNAGTLSVMGLSGEDLTDGTPKSARGLTTAQFKAVTTHKHPLGETTESAKSVKATAEKAAVVKTDAFALAHTKAKAGRKVRAGRWASGLVKHQGYDEAVAVKAAVKAANSATPSWKAAVKAAAALAGS